jgi:dTDP-4-dehydrorhamnose 3,5-epimerase
MNLSSKAKSEYKLQSYAASPTIEGVSWSELRRFNDSGGSMMELLRFESLAEAGLTDFTPRQLNYSILHSGVIKAFHLHKRQTDVWFVPPEDRVLLVLVDVREGSPTEGVQQSLMLGDGRSGWIRVPPGVAHGCRNLGEADARILYLTDVTFDAEPSRCDEGRLPWDYVGADVWEIPNE